MDGTAKNQHYNDASNPNGIQNQADHSDLGLQKPFQTECNHLKDQNQYKENEEVISTHIKFGLHFNNR